MAAARRLGYRARMPRAAMPAVTPEAEAAAARLVSAAQLFLAVGALPALLLKHAWATPIAEVAAKTRCSSSGSREV